MIKYLIQPGYVYSKTDEQRHYIGIAQLMDLYRVDPSECRIARGAPGEATGLTVLAPRYDGDYTLPKNKDPGEP